MNDKEAPLAFLLRLNLELAERETKAQSVTPPGLPLLVSNRADFVSEDCITASGIG